HRAGFRARSLERQRSRAIGCASTSRAHVMRPGQSTGLGVLITVGARSLPPPAGTAAPGDQGKPPARPATAPPPAPPRQSPRRAGPVPKLGLDAQQRRARALPTARTRDFGWN